MLVVQRLALVAYRGCVQPAPRAGVAVRLVCVADLHVHPWRLCSRDGGHDRLMDGLSVLRQSLDLARSLGAAWVFAGDIKQPKNVWPQSALTGIHEILREFEDVQKVMLAGNHDAWGEGGTGLAPFKDCANIIDTAYLAIEYGPPNTRMIFAPWDADLDAVRKMVKQNPTAGLFAHGFIQGCMIGPEDVRIAKGTPVADYGNFPFAVFGDVHKGQWREPGDPAKGRPAVWRAFEGPEVREAGPWGGEVFYTGSTLQQNWGERNDPPKGALIVDLVAGSVMLKELKAPRYHHLELDEAGLRTFVETSARQAYAGGFVRVVYTGKPCKALDESRKFGDGGMFRSFQLVVRRAARSEARAELHAGMPMSEILTNYVAARPPADLDPARTLEALTRLA